MPKFRKEEDRRNTLVVGEHARDCWHGDGGGLCLCTAFLADMTWREAFILLPGLLPSLPPAKQSKTGRRQRRWDSPLHSLAPGIAFLMQHCVSVPCLSSLLLLLLPLLASSCLPPLLPFLWILILKHTHAPPMPCATCTCPSHLQTLCLCLPFLPPISPI